MKRIVSVLVTAVMLMSTVFGVFAEEAQLILASGSQYRFSEDRSYIVGIEGIPDAAEVAGQFADPSSVVIEKPDGTRRTGKIASDDVAVCGEERARLLVYGDVDRSGDINARDIIAAMRYMCGYVDDICIRAVDVNEDGKTNAADIILIMRYLVGDDVVLGNITYAAEEFKIDDTYRIVIPENADETLTEAATLLSTALDSLYETWLGKKWIVTDSTRAENEIILGAANRQYSRNELRKLSSDGYTYNIVKPSRIVIAGSDSEGTYEAVEQFLWENFGYIDRYNTIHSAKIWNGEEYVDIKGSTTLTSAKSSTVLYPTDKVALSINGTPVEKYTLVPRNDRFAATADIINRNIRLLTGISLPVDISYTGENAIYVGRISNGGNYSSAGLEYNIGCEGSSIYIDAFRLNVSRFAARAFSKKYLRDFSADVNISIDKNTVGGYNSNLLEMTSSEEHSIAKGFTYREADYTDQHGLPVKVFALVMENGAGKLKLGTPNGEKEISGALATTTAEVKTFIDAGEHAVAGLNGDFFDLGASNYPLGLCVKDGVVMQNNKTRPWFAVMNDGSYMMGTGSQSQQYVGQMSEAIGGSHLVLKNGYLSDLGQDSDFGGIRHPRSAIGYTGEGDIVMLVVDGRRVNYSNGASLTDLALILRDFGVTNAMNLDGGGSSTLALVDDADVVIKNAPSDLSERAVYNSLVAVIEDQAK